jgi:hypothetical protein
MTHRDAVIHDEVMSGTFHDKESAERAYQTLIRRGYKPEEIHLIMSEDTRKQYYADTPEVGSKAAAGGMAGATVVALSARSLVRLPLPAHSRFPDWASPWRGRAAGLGAGATAASSGLIGAGIPHRPLRGGHHCSASVSRRSRH